MSAEMQAGIQGHAFLAEWLRTKNLTGALAAFDAAAERDAHAARPGWYSHSAFNLLHECPSKYYLSRTLGLRKRREPDPEADAKALERQAAVVSQARDACIWLAESGNDGTDRFTTWGTEVYLETPPPFKFRMFLDQLAWDTELDCLTVIDHKFTWRADARIAARMLYGDQLLLYAATWNRLIETWEPGIERHGDPRDIGVSWIERLPRIEVLTTRIIVVNAKGKHSVMPAEQQMLSPEREDLFWERALRAQEHASAFESQCAHTGWDYARRFMQPSACIVFSACPYIPICHQGAKLDGPQYESALAGPELEEDSE